MRQTEKIRETAQENNIQVFFFWNDENKSLFIINLVQIIKSETIIFFYVWTDLFSLLNVLMYAQSSRWVNLDCL